MILDKEMELSNAQAVTVSAKSTNNIDLGPGIFAGHSNGADPGDPMGLLITVDETVAAAGAATVTFQVRSSDASDMSGAVIHSQSAPIGKAALTAGAVVPFLPYIPMDAKRYVDVYYSIGTGPLTAGKFSIRGVAGRELNVGSASLA